MEQSRIRAIVLVALTGGALLSAWAGWQVVRPAAPAQWSGLVDVPRVVPAGQRVIVEVLNGSTVPGAARIATRVLRRAGFDVVFFGNAPERVDSTLILVRGDAPQEGAWLREALGVGSVRAAEDARRRIDFTVILGPDWRPPPGIIP